MRFLARGRLESDSNSLQGLNHPVYEFVIIGVVSLFFFFRVLIGVWSQLGEGVTLGLVGSSFPFLSRPLSDSSILDGWKSSTI